MNENKKLEKELFEKLTESQKTLKSILEDTKNIQTDTDRVNSLKEIFDEIESVINQLKNGGNKGLVNFNK